MTSTRTHTLTREEQAIMDAVGVYKNGRRGKWTLAEIAEMVHENAASSDNVDVPNSELGVILGQLIQRGLVRRAPREEGSLQRYTRD